MKAVLSINLKLALCTIKISRGDGRGGRMVDGVG